MHQYSNSNSNFYIHWFYLYNILNINLQHNQIIKKQIKIFSETDFYVMLM